MMLLLLSIHAGNLVQAGIEGTWEQNISGGVQIYYKPCQVYVPGPIQLRQNEGRQKHLQDTSISVQVPQPQQETLISGYENSNFLLEDTWISKKEKF